MLQIKIFKLPLNTFKLNLVNSFLLGIKRSLGNDFEKFCWFHDPDPKTRFYQVLQYLPNQSMQIVQGVSPSYL